MRRTIAIDLIIALFAALFLTQWGAHLIFVYFEGGMVNGRLATLIIIIGIVGISTIVTRPIGIKIEYGHFLTIYSAIGLSRINYDLPKDISSAEWIKNGEMLEINFKNGKKYRFSKHSFFGLRKIFKSIVLMEEKEVYH